MRSKAIAASNLGITNAQKDSLTDQLRDLTLQIDQIADNAGFNGKNLLVETRSDLNSSTFDVSSQISTSRPSLGAAADVDGDGDIDFSFGNSTAEISLLSNDGSGGFTESNLHDNTANTIYTRPVLEDLMVMATVIWLSVFIQEPEQVQQRSISKIMAVDRLRVQARFQMRRHVTGRLGNSMKILKAVT